MDQIIKKVIEDGVKAPSGENCQPWRFVWRNNKLEIYNLPEADQSLYNFNQKGSLVAHGALIENIVISATQSGYQVEVEVAPNRQTNLVSTLTFKTGNQPVDKLYSWIDQRGTNRKDYSGEKLSTEQKAELFNIAKQSGLGELKLIDQDELLQALGQSLAINEEVLFGNKELHRFFYDHILWKEEEQDKAGGFYIKTLEFLPHQLKGVKLFKSWLILRILNKLAGASKMIVKENAEKYAKSGTIGVIIAKGNSDADWVNAGRTFERVWLTATKLGLSLHPCTGVLYFMERIKGGDKSAFSPCHLKLIEEAYRNILKVFSAEGQAIPMMFRLGFAEPPSARSRRMPPRIEIK